MERRFTSLCVYLCVTDSLLYSCCLHGVWRFVIISVFHCFSIIDSLFSLYRALFYRGLIVHA